MTDAVGKQINFRCNICNHRNERASDKFHREIPNCDACGSTPRFRGLAIALSKGLFEREIPLQEFPTSKHLTGIGMSDWEPLAKLLSEKFTHTNTYYHTEPRFDVMSTGLLPYSNLDYVICSEVFEHVVPPLESGFRNLCKCLRPGGTLVFSTPYTSAPETTEHFPGMRSFGLCKVDDEWVLVSKDVSGNLSVHRNLVFHGGPGTVVEMRVFGEAHLFALLKAAGFTNIRAMDMPIPEFGYYWPIGVERPEIGYSSLNFIIVATAGGK